MKSRQVTMGIFVLAAGAAVMAGALSGAEVAGAVQAELDRSSQSKPSGSFSYRKIASSHHPAVMTGDWRCKVGREWQLFVDDYLIYQMGGLKRVLHSVRKYEGNPIMQPETAWEIKKSAGKPYGNCLAANGTIVRDPATGEWRMYYAGGFRHKCLAVSKDLLHWERPVLGLVEFEGSKANNIVIDDVLCDSLSVICTPDDPDPKRRWKAALYHNKYMNSRPEAVYAYFSEDGIHWVLDPQPIMASYVNASGKTEDWSSSWPLAGVGDVLSYRYDERLKCYVGYVKLLTFRGDKYFRSRGMCESDDFVHWSEPRLTLMPDEEDPEDLHLYGNTGWPYESLWLGTLRGYHEIKGNVDLQLISSRDGRHWERAGDRASLVPNGPPGSYDEGYMTEFTNPPIAVGDDLWFFYGATTTTGKEEKPKWRGTIDLGILRKDGFVSLDAGESEGWVVTRPLQFDGKALYVNAEAKGGEVRVEVLDFEYTTMPPRAGQAIDGYSAGECEAVRGDGVCQAVRWVKHGDMSSLAGQHVRLKFIVKNAKLYSFAIQ